MSDIDPDSPALRPVLHRGDTGEAVRTVQVLLLGRGDGNFGSDTEAAVKGFQRGVALDPDGVVGPMTWAELDNIEQLPADMEWVRNVAAEVMLPDRWPDDFGVAFGDHQPDLGDWPQIEVVNVDNGHRVICDVVDGPVNAGIGLTPAAAREIGIEEKGHVHWAIAIELDEGE